MSAVLLTAAWLAVSVSAVSPARPDGQRLYDQGDYAAAAQCYLQALGADPRNAGLHYDLGNALFKSGKTGQAIAAYQRAFDLEPRDADIRQNLDYALRRAGEELVPPGTPPLLFLAFHLFSERELAGLQWLACWVTLIGAGLLLWRPRLRPRLASAAVAAATAWLLLAGWWLALRGVNAPRRGVIVAPRAELRSGPGENFNVSFTVPEGRRLHILSQEGDWLEVGVLKEGVKGWLASTTVEPI